VFLSSHQQECVCQRRLDLDASTYQFAQKCVSYAVSQIGAYLTIVACTETVSYLVGNRV
jgi:hypothetical protein